MCKRFLVQVPLYGKTTVLKDVSLAYRSGVINGIIGSNGAGKSTLLNCVAGYISYSGSIDRKNIKKIGLLTANPYHQLISLRRNIVVNLFAEIKKIL